MAPDFSTTPIDQLATIVANHLDQQNIKLILVGGLTV